MTADNINLNEKNNTEISKIEQEQEKKTNLLTIFDENVLQNIFTSLVYSYQVQERSVESSAVSSFLPTFNRKIPGKLSTYDFNMQVKELKTILPLILNFQLTCKKFLMVSKQNLFTLILNQNEVNLNYQEYLKMLLVKKFVEGNDFYEKKDVDAMFYKSCYRGYYDILDILYNSGANINTIQGPHKWTPLMVATCNRKIKTVQKLISKKELKINQTDINGKTTLMNACFYSMHIMVPILVSRKDIDINIKDLDGKTAFQISNHYGYPETSNIIQNYQYYQI